ncbi:SDR family NAD(P)-dependent oxidoreductase [Paraburkholderia phenoliruptrix]|uniref:SDR family NAD(P)-dependent oxidoreductase n=1 Tax=Paraburkholderia phenoliruptrix TaxID=252970 RepID=UPI002869EADA|nr:SDR family NAD(P)-dependent oxidoreductase [Paraburkholderia phenoliruptrix]WMY11270.1 SDR family NAD(P)-dependent oxidoreductase [Paraburkholderia phenoliruptrix]
MQFDFNSKIVLVTGAASGIGLQTAGEFLNAGATVILSDRDSAAVRQAVTPMPTPRHGFGAAVYHNKNFAIVGSPNPGGDHSTVVEIFTPVSPNP